jgi:poly(A) polymerase
MGDTTKQILREGLILEVRVKQDITIPDDILKIKDVFKKNGYKLYVVGGAVRDALLGKTPKDFDLATDAVPDDVERILNKAKYRTLPTGKQFGVINVFTDKDEYEIATFREDVGTDGRRPDSVSFTNIEGDVKRRDLTINALFYDIDTREVVDLVGGIQDLKNGVVRTVGDPSDRFNEDRLRILRAIRFAGRFGSELDPATDAALKKDASLDKISGERIRDEFIKGLQSAKSQRQYLQMIQKYGLFDWVFRGLKVDESVISHLRANHDDYIVLLARLLKGNNVDTLKKVLNQLKYSVDEVRAITFLVAMLQLSVDTAVTLKRAQEHSKTNPDQVRSFCKQEGVDEKLLNAFEAFRLTISGQEVMDTMGIKAGPEVGQTVQRLETDNFKKLLGIS